MANSTGPKRGMIVVGDKTTAGGVVIEGSPKSSVKGKAVALEGHAIRCPVCGTVGHIQLMPPFAGAPVDGVEIALSDDLCICACNPPPRLISSNVGFATHGFSAEELGDPAAAPWLVHAGHDPAEYALPFDEQFLLQDSNGKPLAGVYFSVKLPTGKIVHGTTSSGGLTERYQTEGVAHIEVYLGHIGVKFPAPLAKATTNIKPGSVVVAKSERLGKPWRISESGLAFLGQLESGVLNGKFNGYEVIQGMITEVYDDGTGILTVGLGHRVYSEDKLTKGEKISVERAQDFLRKDLSRFESAVNNLTMVPLHQYEYDALVSILFNTGAERGKHDSSPKTRAQRVADIVNIGCYKSTSESLAEFFIDLVKWRRALESKLFSTGVYNAKH